MWCHLLNEEMRERRKGSRSAYLSPCFQWQAFIGTTLVGGEPLYWPWFQWVLWVTIWRFHNVKVQICVSHEVWSHEDYEIMGTTVYHSAPPWSPVQGQVYLYYPSMKCAHIYKWLSQVLDIDTCMGKKTYKSKLPNLWPVDPGFFLPSTFLLIFIC